MKFRAAALVRERIEFLHCLIKDHIIKTHVGGEVELTQSWCLYSIEVSEQLHAPAA